MGPTTELRRELKRTFFPFVQGRGFCIDHRDAPTFTRFRRHTPEAVHLFEVQWEKYGAPRFVINFGTSPPQGLEINGELHAPERLYVGWLPRNGRLQPKGGTSSRSWFRQDESLLRRWMPGSRKLRAASDVVDELLHLFAELEAYWNDGTVGQHLRMSGRR